MKNDPHFNQSGAAGGFRSRLLCARWNYKHCLEYLWWQLDGYANVPRAGQALAGSIKQTPHTVSTTQRIIEIIIMSLQSGCWCINSVLYITQVFGGRVQENALLPMARQPDSLQSRLFILHYMEDYAKFQVNILRCICRHSLEESIIVIFFLLGVISSRMPMSSCVTCWTTSTGSSRIVAMGPLTQPPPRMGSDSQLLMENAACKLQNSSSTIQSMPHRCQVVILCSE